MLIIRMEKKQFFVAKVLVGDPYICPSNDLIHPPSNPKFNNNLEFKGRRFDSVGGNTGGSDVYIVYENNLAYPAFLVTYE